MKKISLIFSFLIVSFVSTAQITLHNEEANNTINEGDIITVSENYYTTHVTVTNDYSTEINLQLELVSANNTNGQELSMCFGVAGQGSCHAGIHVGDVFQGGAPLAAGSTTAHTDIDFQHIDGLNNSHFPNYPKDYVIKISALNTSDNSELSSVTFTYRYDPNGQGAVNTFDKNDMIISTAQPQFLIVESKFLADMTLYNLTGQKVKEVSLKPMQNSIYTGNLTKGIYIVHVTAGRKELYKKIILR